MKFNFRKSLDFPPIFNFDNDPSLNVVTEAKILGILISDDLRWSAQVRYMRYIINRANKKILTIRRMKLLKVDTYIITDFYVKEIRLIL